MKEKIIDSVKIYQAVSFEKKSETFFSTREIGGRKGRKIRTVDHGIEVESDLDCVMIPYANVACIYYLSKLKEENIQKEKDSKSKKVGVKAQDIKRPK